jgi:outer membrane PBP1 activator LpoA protein
MSRIKKFLLILFFISGIINAGASPHNIALLVPLSGNLANSGQAIQNGFLTAYYYMRQQGNTDAEVKIIDTAKGEITEIYQQAVKDGADFIVGPLTKENLKALSAKSSLPVVTLALNTVDNYQNNKTKNLYQFGLSSQDEALQTAEKAWHDHPGRALIIVPNSPWGDNLLNMFKRRWESLGGSVIAALEYNDSNLMRQVQQVFNINLSQNTSKILQNNLHKKINFINHRRQDIDVILLAAFPSAARQIKPLLNFYYAGDIPIYATSALYNGIAQPNLDRDLDGVIFCDIPWVLPNIINLSATLQSLNSQIIKTWPESYKANAKLYALGIDAWFMTINFDKILAQRDGVQSATGILTVDQYNHVYRKLYWAQMKNGIPSKITNDNNF